VVVTRTSKAGHLYARKVDFLTWMWIEGKENLSPGEAAAFGTERV
jgi:hypothetical protein